MTTAPAPAPGPAGARPESATMADSAATRAFRERIARVDAQAEEAAARRQHPKGKSTARERIAELLDADSFLEIGRYTGSGAGEGARPSGVVTGFGQIGGRQVAVYSQDFSVSGGALGAIEGDKIVRLLDDALRLRIPVIGLIDSRRAWGRCASTGGSSTAPAPPPAWCPRSASSWARARAGRSTARP